MKKSKTWVGRLLLFVFALQLFVGGIIPTSASAADDSFYWPVPGYYNITGPYTGSGSSNHRGVDISSSGIQGKTVYAAKGGTVYISYNGCPHVHTSGTAVDCGCWCENSMGNFVWIRHDDGSGARYMHLEQGSAIAQGTRVEKGDPIGRVGSSGYSSGYHLHFEVLSGYNTLGSQINTNPTDGRHTGSRGTPGMSYIYELQPLSVVEYRDCFLTISLPARTIDLYRNVTDTTRYDYFDYGPTIYVYQYAVMSDGTIRYRVTANSNGTDMVFWFTETSDMTISGTYNVAFNGNGGSVSPYELTKTHGVPLALSNVTASRSGYTLLGWSESSTATAPQYYTWDSFEKNANTVLYAVWEAEPEYEYTVDSSGNATINGYIGSNTVISIPSSIDGHPVTAIRTFLGNSSYGGPASPGNISYTPGNLSAGGNLISVTIPASVVYVAPGAFSACDCLTEICVDPNNAYYSAVNGVLFNKSRTLLHTYPPAQPDTGFAIPDGVSEIGDYAFLNNNSIMYVTMPVSVTRIGELAFYMTYLDSVNYMGNPSDWSGISIGEGNLSLTNATRYYYANPFYYQLNSGGGVTLTGYTGGSFVTIPTSIGGRTVTALGGSLFYNITVTDLFLPDTVTSVGAYAFYGTGPLNVFYGGTVLQWNSMNVSAGNTLLLNADLYCDKELVYYDGNGGGSGIPGMQVKARGSTLTLSSAVPVREGYNFLGWSESTTATEAQYQPGDLFNREPKTAAYLYAVWQKKTYNINYDGGNIWGVYIKTHGDPLIIPSGPAMTPTREGYTFLGWSESSTATEAQYLPGDSFTKDADTTLYAVWAVKTYTISYNANGGYDAPASQTKIHGTALTLRDQSILPHIPLDTPDGGVVIFTFLGWAESSDATAAQYLPGGNFTRDADTTLYAVWQARTTYAVSYYVEGERYAFIQESQGYSHLVINAPSREGYIFLGWAESSNAAAARYQPGDRFTLEANTTLYAVWQEEPKVPGAVTPVTATGSAGKITVSWTAAENAARYVVARQVSGSTSWVILASNVTENSFVDRSVTAGVQYRYRVRAYNDQGSGGSAANSAYAVPLAALPAAIESVTATAAPGKITVTWPAAQYATRYVVARQTYGSSSWSALADNVTATSYVDSTAAAGTKYRYRVRAYNDAGSGAAANSAYVTAG